MSDKEKIPDYDSCDPDTGLYFDPFHIQVITDLDVEAEEANMLLREVGDKARHRLICVLGNDRGAIASFVGTLPDAIKLVNFLCGCVPILITPDDLVRLQYKSLE